MPHYSGISRRVEWYFVTDVLGQPISWLLKMGPIGCALLSLTNYHSVLHKTPKDHTSHFHRGISLKSRTKFLFKQFSRSTCHILFTSKHSPKHPVLKPPIFFPCNKILNFIPTQNNRQTYSLHKGGKKRLFWTNTSKHFQNLFCSYII
jgi:hypothetical protein